MRFQSTHHIPMESEFNLLKMAEVRKLDSLIVPLMGSSEDYRIRTDPQLHHHVPVRAQHGEDATLVSLRLLQLHQQAELLCKPESKHRHKQFSHITVTVKNFHEIFLNVVINSCSFRRHLQCMISKYNLEKRKVTKRLGRKLSL